MPTAYVKLCKALYTCQVGKVVTQVESRTFAIKRGTKQGDPMSPKLFNAVLQSVFEPLVAKWAAQGGGVQDQEGRQLTNLRLADDVLLMTGSPQHLQNMVGDLVGKSATVGLQLHYGKTRVLCN